MKKSKIVALLLSGMMMVGALASCGGSKAPEATEAPAAEAEATEEAMEENHGAAMADLKVGVFYYTFADTYISTVRDAMDTKLKDAGVDFVNYDANGEQTKQSEYVDTALADGVNLLVVNIVETASVDAAQDIVNKAKAKDVPVIFFNREIKDEVVKSYEKCAFVGTDAAQAGHMQGQMIAEYLLKDYDKYDLNKDGKISYILFKGQMNNPEADARTQFSVEDADKLLADAGKPALVFYDEANTDKYHVDQDGFWSAKASSEYMTSALANFNDNNNNMIEMVIANNDGMAEGAVNALNTVGYNKKGGDKIIPVFGVDAIDSTKALIADGVIAGTIKQDAEGMADTIVKLVMNVKEGKGLMENLDGYVVDEGVDKIRVPYQIYLGE